MGGTEPAVELASKGIEAAKKALEALTKEPESSTATKGSGSAPDEVLPPEVHTGLTPGAAAAVDRFRRTARWIAGAFAAVGVLVFGSLPFASIGEASADSWQLITGLGLASVGISIAIWAASRVDEPEDANLGELRSDLAKVQSAWIRPSKKALLKLKDQLAGADGLNQIGPMYPGVDVRDTAEERISALIESLGRAAKARYWRAADVAAIKVSRDAAIEDLASRTEQLKTAWDRWVKAVELASQKSPPQAGSGGDPR